MPFVFFLFLSHFPVFGVYFLCCTSWMLVTPASSKTLQGKQLIMMGDKHPSRKLDHLRGRKGRSKYTSFKVKRCELHMGGNSNMAHSQLVCVWLYNILKTNSWEKWKAIQPEQHYTLICIRFQVHLLIGVIITTVFQKGCKMKTRKFQMSQLLWSATFTLRYLFYVFWRLTIANLLFNCVLWIKNKRIRIYGKWIGGEKIAGEIWLIKTSFLFPLYSFFK